MILNAKYSLHHIEIKPDVYAAVHRFRSTNSSKPLFMLHGSMESGRIFYSKNGKGLGPFLANKEYDVFIADLPGRGESRPETNKNFDYTQSELIKTGIDCYLDFIALYYPEQAVYTIAHSWGGVIILAWYARYGNLNKIKSMVFFGTKRRLAVISLRRIFAVDLMWNLLGSAATAILGYLPAKKLKMGSDNEPGGLYRQTNYWVNSKNWLDPEDQFDYKAAIRNKEVPPVLYVAAINDKILGNPSDVERLMGEVNSDNSDFLLLGKHYGNLKDYDHINMLTDRKAVDDHFLKIENWLKNGSPGAVATEQEIQF